MKRHLLVAAVAVFGFFMCFVSAVSLSQEQGESTENSWGIVSSLSSEQIVVTEYNYDSDEEVDVTYTIDLKVKLVNIELLTNIKVGDSVEIDYVIIEDKNIAKVITVEKSSYEEECTPLEKESNQSTE